MLLRFLRPRFPCSPEDPPAGGAPSKDDPPPPSPSTSEAAAELARAKARSEAEAKASRPATVADVAAMEAAIREDLRKGTPVAVPTKKSGAGWVAPLVAGLLVVGGLVFVFLRKRKAATS